MTEAPFVGRRHARHELRRALAGARRSRGTVVLVSGEAGIGKTRLVEEVCAEAEGFRVVWSSCATAGDSSLQPWPSVLRSLAATDARVSRLTRRSALDEHVSPALEERAQLVDDLVTALELGAAPDPLVVVVDDLHAAGPSALELLARLAPELRGLPVVVLATARDDDFAWRASGEARVSVLRAARRVELGPLPDDDVVELVRALADADADAPARADAIAARAGGNPLFAVELARLAPHSGASTTSIPASVRAVVTQRVHELPSGCRARLATAAVVGTRFDLEVVAEAAMEDLTTVRASLDDAERAGVVAFDEPGRGRFTHDLVRDALYETLTAAERAHEHERVAAVLDAFAARGRGQDAAAVARHLLQAGPSHVTRAAASARRAGDEARRMGAYEDAAMWYGEAVGALRASGAPVGDQGEVLLARADARLGAGDRAGARADFVAVADRARHAGLPSLLAHAALGLGAGPTGFEVTLLDREQVDLLEEAWAGLPEDEVALRSLVAARLSIALTGLAPDGRRRELAQVAYELGGQAADAQARAVALAALCDAHAGPDDTHARLRWTEEMLGCAADARDPGIELLARRLRVVALFETGAVHELDAEIRDYRLRTETWRHPLYQWFVPLWYGARALMEGRLSECAARNDEVAALAARSGSENARMLWGTQRWCLLVEQGDRAELTGLIAELPSPEVAVWMQVTWALVTAQIGDVDDARRRLDAVAPALETLPRDSEWLATLAQVAETIALVGPHPVGEWVYAELLPYGDQFAVEGIGAAVRGPVHLHLGLLAASIGDGSAARGHHTAARASCTAIGAVQLLPRIDVALVALDAGEGRAAEKHAFRREGDGWLLRYAGREVRVRDAKGLRDLAVLLATPGREVAAVDLAGDVRSGDTGPLLDERARTEYRARLTELEAEIDAAHLANDRVRAERLETERDALVAQLTQAFGLGGRARRAGSAVERARTRVTARVRDAVRRIDAVHPDLGRHLDESVRTGTFCVYAPDPAVQWEV